MAFFMKLGISSRFHKDLRRFHRVVLKRPHTLIDYSRHGYSLCNRLFCVKKCLFWGQHSLHLIKIRIRNGSAHKYKGLRVTGANPRQRMTLAGPDSCKSTQSRLEEGKRSWHEVAAWFIFGPMKLGHNFP